MPRPADAYPAPEATDQGADVRAATAPDDTQAVGLLSGEAEAKILGAQRDHDALAIDPREARRPEAAVPTGRATEDSDRGPVDSGRDNDGDGPGTGAPNDGVRGDDRPVTARDLGLIGQVLSEDEQARLAAARDSELRLGRMALRLEDPRRAAERESLRPADENRLHAAHFLNDERATPRDVVRREEARVRHLLDEPVVEARPETTGQGMFARVGSRIAEGRQQAAHDRWEARQEVERGAVLEDLDHTREMIRIQIVGTPEEAEIDRHIGLREQGDTILPEHFKRMHHAEEERLGRQVSFMEWASTYAGDGQLQNVWQWHDHYMRTQDSDPEYQAQVARVTDGYNRGLQAAIAAGEFHLSMAENGRSEEVTFRHDSPLSPLIAISVAYDDETTNTVYTRDNVGDYWLYHERAHQGGGFATHIGEGATELIATTIYDHAHESEPPRDLRLSPYWDNILTIASLNNVAEHTIGLYGLTQFYAASHNVRLNTVAFMRHGNEEAGLAVNDGVNDVGLQVLTNRLQQADLATVRYEMYSAMRQEAEFYEAMLLDEHGHRVPQSLDELAARMTAQETVERFGIQQVNRGLEVVEFTRLQQREMRE